MKCAAKWVGVISAVLLVAGVVLVAGQLYAQGENSEKAPASKLVWQPGVGWITAPATAPAVLPDVPAIAPVSAPALEVPAAAPVVAPVGETAVTPAVTPTVAPVETPAVVPAATPAEVPAVVPAAPAEVPAVVPAAPAEVPAVVPAAPAEVPAVVPAAPAEVPAVVPAAPAEVPAVVPAVSPVVTAPAVEAPVATPAVVPVVTAPVVEAPVATPAVAPVAAPVAEIPAVAPVVAPAVEPVVVAPVVVAPATEAPAATTAATPAVTPAVTPAATPAVNINAMETPRDALISEMVTLERLRRNIKTEHGMSNLEAGRKALRDGEYEEARKQFTMAESYIQDNPETRKAREEATAGIGEALYLNAQVMRSKGDLQKAVQLARQAKERGHPDATKLAADIQKDIENPPKVVPPKEMSRMLEATYKEDRDGVLRHLRLARQYFIVGDYDRSRQELELILRDHPYNTEAMDMLKKIGDRTFDTSVDEFEATRARMIRDVKASWSPRRYAIDTVDIKEPTASQSHARTLLPGGITIEQSIEEKMRRIVIPEIAFKNASINDVKDFFESASREFDDTSLPPEKRGVNFALKGVASVAPAAAPATTAADPFATEAAAAPVVGGGSPVTLTARFLDLWGALKICTDNAGFKFRIRSNVVIIMPLNTTDDIMETRSYTVMPNVIERATGVAKDLGATKGTTGGGETAIAATEIGPAQDLKKLFGDLGVQWPVGSSISYLSVIGKLRVVNTADNIAIFEKVLEEMNVTPRQIEIEARFVEVSQSDLDALGVEWAQANDISHHIADGRVTAQANDYSQGLRYLSTGSLGPDLQTPDRLLKVQGVFDELNVTAVLHALSQRSNTDLLSAPKVVTKAGQEAIIKVITEFIYPTTFTVNQGTTAASTTGGSVSSAPTVEPGGFQTREVGVILQVVPEVSAEGQMINLTMNPQVVSEPTWHDYGYSVFTPGATEPTKLPMQQPFFQVRSISTSVSIYNGATVVMGGMITENRVSTEDKVPLLGDLPYLGQFFTSKSEQTVKRNLLIFVTARLVDPAGRSVKTQTEPIINSKKTGDAASVMAAP